MRVDDIKIHPREHDLILATHGRALWVLDDISPLEKPGTASGKARLEVFDIRPAVSFRQFETGGAQEGNKPFEAPNAPYGALITYRLKDKPKEKVKITAIDSSGRTIRELEGTAEAGLNRISWDLRYPTLGEVTPEQVWAISEGFFYRVVPGPLVEPGDYTMRVSVGDEAVEKKLHVQEDPNISISAQDRAVRHQAIVRGWDLYKTAFDGSERFTKFRANLTKTVDSWKEKDAPAIPAEAKKQAEELAKKIKDLEPSFVSPSDFANLPLHVIPPVADRIAHAFFNIESVYGSAAAAGP